MASETFAMIGGCDPHSSTILRSGPSRATAVLPSRTAQSTTRRQDFMTFLLGETYGTGRITRRDFHSPLTEVLRNARAAITRATERAPLRRYARGQQKLVSRNR